MGWGFGGAYVCDRYVYSVKPLGLGPWGWMWSFVKVANEEKLIDLWTLHPMYDGVSAVLQRREELWC